MADTNLTKLIINKLTKAQYDQAVLDGKINPNEMYFGKGSRYLAEEEVNEIVNSKIVSMYIFKGSVETFEDLPTEELVVGWVYDVRESGVNYAWDGARWDSLGSIEEVDLSAYSTTAEMNQAIASALVGKQNVLVSGIDIKTINGGTILDSGDLLLVTPAQMQQAIFMNDINIYEDEEIFHVKSMSNDTSQIASSVELTLNMIEGNTVDNLINRDDYIENTVVDGVTIAIQPDKTILINGTYTGTEIKEINLLPLQNLTLRENRNYFFHGTQIYTDTYSFIVLDNLNVPIIDSQKGILKALTEYEFATNLKLKIYPGASFNNLVCQPVLIDITNSLYEDFSIEHLRDIFIEGIGFGLINTTPTKLTSVKNNQCKNNLSNVFIDAVTGVENASSNSISSDDFMFIPLGSDVSIFYYDLDGKQFPLSPRWYDVNKNYIGNVRTANGFYLRVIASSETAMAIDSVKFMVTLAGNNDVYEEYSEHIENINGLENLKSVNKDIADYYANGKRINKIAHYTITGLEEVVMEQGIFSVSLPVESPRGSSKNIFSPSKSTTIPSSNTNSALTINTLGVRGSLHKILIYYPEFSTPESMKSFLRSKFLEGVPVTVFYEMEEYTETPLVIENTLLVHPQGSVNQVYNGIPYVIKYNTMINLKDSNIKSVGLLEELVIKVNALETNTYNKYYTERLIKSEIALSGSGNDRYTNEQIDSKLSTKANQTEVDLKANKSEVYTQQQTVDVVEEKISELFVAAPEDLNTINSIVAAVQENQEVNDILNAAIGAKADKTEVYTRLQLDAEFAAVRSEMMLEPVSLADEAAYDALSQAEKDKKILYILG